MSTTDDLEEGLEDFGTGLQPVPEPSSSSLSDGIQEYSGRWSTLMERINKHWRLLVWGGSVLLFLLALLVAGIVLVNYGHKTKPNLEYPMWDSWRLPSYISPWSYNMNLTVDVAKGTIRGTETIRVAVNRVTNFVVLHATEEVRITKALLAVTPEPTRSPGDEGLSLRAEIDNAWPADHIIYDPKYQIYKLQWAMLGEKTGSSAQLTDFLIGLEWVGKLSDDMRGIYRSKYHEGQKEVVLVSTQFESTDARAMFPCFDEPAMKARFVITVNSNRTRTAVLSNMPVSSQTTVGDMLRTTFEPTPRMSTYLVALVISNFQSVGAAKHPAYPVRVWARPEVASQGQYAADISAAILDEFGKYFEVDYLLPKMDLAAIPDFNAGAMENWGLMTFRETALLVDPVNSGTLSQQIVAEVVAHELAHQWFGDTVTMAWWDDVWLNEGFASFVEYIGVDRVQPEWKIWNYFVAGDQQRALYEDSLHSTHPVSSNATSPSEIGGLFGAIIYSKGASVLRMLEAYLEASKPDSFRKGLAAYLKKHMYGNAATSDLWRALAQSSGIDVAEMMASWTKRPGYPVLRVIVGADNALSFEQERFVLESQSPEHPIAEYYHVPVQFKYISSTGAIATGEVIIKETRASTAVPNVYDPGRPFVVNADRRGFYRVLYPTAMLDKIIEEALNPRTSILTVSDISGTIDDMFRISFSNRDHIEYKVDLRRLFQLCKNAASTFRSSVVVRSAIETLLTAASYIDEATKQNANKVVSRILDIVEGSLVLDSHDAKLLSSYLSLVGVRVKHAAMGPQSATDFRNFKSGQPLHPDYRVAAYHAAVSEDYFTSEQVQDNFNWLLTHYEESGSTASDRADALYALCYTTNLSLLQRLLSIALNEQRIRQQDTSSLLSHCSVQYRDIVWAHLKEHYTELEQRYAKHLFTFASLIERVTSGFRTEERRTDVRLYLGGRGFDATRLAGILDSIDSHITWNAYHGATVSAWMSENSSP